jgi:hypothetical protein
VEQTIPAVLIHAAREYGDAAALAEPGGPRLSYLELHEQAILVARALMAQGVQPGERVALWSPNTHHWVLAALGTLYAGATLVPVSTRFTGHEALDVISRSGARGLIVAGPFLGTDRLAALRAAAAEETVGKHGPGAALGRLRLVVSVPVEDRPAGGGPAAGGPGEHGPPRPRGAPGRCQRHPVHLRHHRAEQGRDDRSSPVSRRGPGLG